MIERRRRFFGTDFLSDTGTFYPCSRELYSQQRFQKLIASSKKILETTGCQSVGFSGLTETDLEVETTNTRTDAKPIKTLCREVLRKPRQWALVCAAD
jgi:hypothetical protein